MLVTFFNGLLRKTSQGEATLAFWVDVGQRQIESFSDGRRQGLGWVILNTLGGLQCLDCHDRVC
jgi:hypothetical protein